MSCCEKANTTNRSIESLIAEINILKHKNEILQTLNTNTTKQYKEIVSLNENLKLQYQIKEKKLMDLHNIELHQVKKENIAIAISQSHLRKINQSLSDELNRYKHQNQLFHDRMIKKDEQIKKIQQEKTMIESELNAMLINNIEYDDLINNQNEALFDMKQTLEIGCNHSMRSNKLISNKWDKTIRIPNSSSPVLRSGNSNSLSGDWYIYDKHPSLSSSKNVTRCSSLIVSDPTGNDGSNDNLVSPRLLRSRYDNKINANSTSTLTQIMQSVTSLSLDIEHQD